MRETTKYQFFTGAIQIDWDGNFKRALAKLTGREWTDEEIAAVEKAGRETETTGKT